MQYKIDLLIKQHTYQELKSITQNLNNGEKRDLAKQLGNVFTDMSCQVLDQVFGALLEEQRNNPTLDATGQKKLKRLNKFFLKSKGLLKNICLGRFPFLVMIV